MALKGGPSFNRRPSRRLGVLGLAEHWTQGTGRGSKTETKARGGACFSFRGSPGIPTVSAGAVCVGVRSSTSRVPGPFAPPFALVSCRSCLMLADPGSSDNLRVPRQGPVRDLGCQWRTGPNRESHFVLRSLVPFVFRITSMVHRAEPAATTG